MIIKNAIAKRAKALIASRNPDFVIGPSADDPYMLRWWWIPRNRFFNVYVHAILQDDDDRALHDHPWPSLSLMIEGQIDEAYRASNGDNALRRLSEGEWVWRGPKFLHRLMLPGAPAITVFITGPRIREWGFACPQGWVSWRDFVAKDDAGSVGRGCGEQ